MCGGSPTAKTSSSSQRPPNDEQFETHRTEVAGAAGLVYRPQVLLCIEFEVGGAARI